MGAIEKEEKINSAEVAALSSELRKTYHLKLRVQDGYHFFTMLAISKDDGTQYYIKVMSKKRVQDRQLEPYVAMERHILEILSPNCEAAQSHPEHHHPFIPRLLEVKEDIDNLCFILEYATKGTLLYHIRDNGTFHEAVAQFYAAELVEAVEFLHQAGNIVHRNIKPEHILLDEVGHIRLSGFEHAKQLPPDQTETHSEIDLGDFQPPEWIGTHSFCKASDLWGIGCVVYYMLIGFSPFKGKNNDEVIANIKKMEESGATLRLPEGLSMDAKAFLSGLLCAALTKRLGTGEQGIQEIKNHAFFKGVPWGQLHLQIPPKITHGIATRAQVLAVKRDDSILYLTHPPEYYFPPEFGSKINLLPLSEESKELKTSNASETDRGCFLKCLKNLLDFLGIYISCLRSNSNQNS